MAAVQEQTTAQCSSVDNSSVKQAELKRKFLQVHVINIQLENRKKISSGVLRLHSIQHSHRYITRKLSETVASVETQFKLNLHNKHKITNEKIKNHNLAFRF